jgi:hypothetical protein
MNYLLSSLLASLVVKNSDRMNDDGFIDGCVIGYDYEASFTTKKQVKMSLDVVVNGITIPREFHALILKLGINTKGGVSHANHAHKI